MSIFDNSNSDALDEYIDFTRTFLLWLQKQGGRRIGCPGGGVGEILELPFHVGGRGSFYTSTREVPSTIYIVHREITDTIDTYDPCTPFVEPSHQLVRPPEPVILVSEFEAKKSARSSASGSRGKRPAKFARDK